MFQKDKPASIFNTTFNSKASRKFKINLSTNVDGKTKITKNVYLFVSIKL